MQNLLRIFLFVSALFLLEFSGDGFLLAIVIDHEAGRYVSAISMAAFFLVGALALLAAFAEGKFSNAWLFVPVAIGLGGLVLSRQTITCENILANDLSYRAYYCSHSEMQWLVSAICLILLAIAIKRKYGEGF